MTSQNFFIKTCSNCGKNIQRHNLNEILACLIYHKNPCEIRVVTAVQQKCFLDEIDKGSEKIT